MKRRVIIKNLLNVILETFSGLNNTSDSYMDIADYIRNEEFINAIDYLSNRIATLPQAIKPVIKTACRIFADGNFNNEEELTNKQYKILLFQTHSENKYARNIRYISDALSIIKTNQLYCDPNEEYSDDLWLVLERFFIDVKRTKKILNELITRSQPCTYQLCYHKVNLGVDVNAHINNEELYAFALASSINQKQVIEIPSQLAFSWGAGCFISNFLYNKDIIYQEYYDIYDTFNDWLHARDILTAFMNMYQIVEYIIYRRQMAEIINRSNIKQSFLRETKSLNDKYVRGERKLIIDDFTQIFNNFALNAGEVSASWGFVDKYFGKTKNGNHYLDTANPQPEIDKGVARFIYDVRCSMVHNKEAEFHILYNNYEEYKDIVPLLVSINNQMAEKIMNLINTANTSAAPNPIHYTNKQLNLY